MDCCFNDGLGLSSTYLITSNLIQLNSNDQIFTQEISNLYSIVSNLNPSNVDVAITALQQEDIVINSNIVILYAGYSNNSNAIHDILINGTGSNYSTQISNLQVGVSNNSNNLTIETLNRISQDLLLNTAINSNSATINGIITKTDTNSNNIYSLSNSLSSQIIKEAIDCLNLNAGYSNNSNNIAINKLGITTLSNYTSNLNNQLIALNSNSSNYATISALATVSNNLSAEISLRTSQDLILDSKINSNSASINTNINNININSNLISQINSGLSNQVFKEAIDCLNINAGISNNNSILGTTNTNLANLSNVVSINTSDIATLFSTSTTLTGVQTLTNKTMDYNLNTFLNFPSSGSNSGSNYDPQISNLQLQITTNSNITHQIDISLSNQIIKEAIDCLNLNSGISNNTISINAQVAKEAVDVLNLNAGYSNNLGLINAQVAKEAVDVLNLNAGYSNNLGLINAQVAKEAVDVLNLNAGISNNITSINAQVAKEAVDVLNLNAGISNNTDIITQVNTSLSNQIIKEAIDVLNLNTGYSNNLGLINAQVAKEAVDCLNLNAGYSNNLGLINAQVDKEAIDCLNLNAGYSNNLGLININTSYITALSLASSNYATAGNTMTFTGKTLDYNSNTFLNLPSGGPTSNYYTSNIYNSNYNGVPFVCYSQTANITTTITTIYTHTLGTVPVIINFSGSLYDNSTGSVYSQGTYITSNNTNQCTYHKALDTSAGGIDTSHCVNNGGGTFNGYVSSISSSNFTVIWTVSGAPSGVNNNILMTAESGYLGAGPSNYYSTSNYNTYTSNNYIGSQWSNLGSTIYTIGSNVGIGTSSALYTLDCIATDGIRIPIGTTSQRPTTSNDGLIRYNTSTSNYEGYSNLTWGTLGGSSSTGGYVETSIKTANYTLVPNDFALFNISAAGANVTATLPATPSANTKVKIALVGSNNTYNLILNRNGSSFMSDNDERYYDLVMLGDTLELEYLNSKWIVISKQITKNGIKKLFTASNMTAPGGIVYNSDEFVNGLITTPGSVTVRRKGVYLINNKANTINANTGGDLYFNIKKNGTIIDYLFCPISTVTGSVNGSFDVSSSFLLTQNDVITMVTTGNTSTKYLNGNASWPTTLNFTET